MSTKHIVGFSGGIDSQACARWVLNRYPPEDVILLNSDAGGNEHPLTTEFVAEYSEKIHPVTCVSALVSDLWVEDGKGVNSAKERGVDVDAVLDFPRLIELKGSPTRKRRTCTEFLKLVPQKRWMKFLTEDYVRYSGNRREESEARKNTPFTSFDSYFDCELLCPIADWTKQMCFEYIRQYGEPINPLYSLGFDRVGCAPCILSGKDDILTWAQRFPEMIDKIRGWEQRTGKTFFQHIVPNMEINFIDDVVAWSQTARGGKMNSLFRVLNGPVASCESKFGLCE